MNSSHSSSCKLAVNKEPPGQGFKLADGCRRDSGGSVRDPKLQLSFLLLISRIACVAGYKSGHGRHTYNQPVTVGACLPNKQLHNSPYTIEPQIAFSSISL